jgi:hypothetical protein
MADGQILYGVGQDPEGYYVAIRLEVKGRAMEYQVDGHFDNLEGALHFMAALADVIETQAASRGLKVVQDAP